MKFIKTLQNIYNIKELRDRILFTLGLLLVYRIGSYILLPGVDPGSIQSNGANEGLLGLINIFSGGAFSQASIFALGVMPYISASIVMQLATLLVPYFQRLQREGESGSSKINQITRYLTIGVTLLQGIGYLRGYLPAQGVNLSPFFFISALIVLIGGTLFIMWLGERITDKGIGNGVSLLITVGIIVSLPSALLQELLREKNSIFLFVVEIAVLLAVVVAVILLIQGTRRVPVQYAKRSVVKGGRVMQSGGVRQFLPLKINASGVMPIIFAQAIMFVPGTLSRLFKVGVNSNFISGLSNIQSPIFNVVFFVLIVLFTYLYTAIQFNPKQIADDIKKNNGFIPGVRPGKNTAEFIDVIMSRITLPGSIFLGFVAILPAFAMAFGVNQNFALFYGGTSLLITVGVVLDTLQQIESHLLTKEYDGLTKTGRIKGKYGAVGSSSI